MDLAEIKISLHTPEKPDIIASTDIKAEIGQRFAARFKEVILRQKSWRTDVYQLVQTCILGTCR